MVYQDISQSFELHQQTKKKSAAQLMDRFFSFLIDYLVISPFVFFFLYLSFGDGFSYWKSHPDAAENEAFVLLMGFCFVVFFSLIQSLFISVWRATPGQYFLKIELDFQESDSLVFFRAFLRQFAFWISFIFLGLPFLAMLTNKWRRTFYDRLADVSVLSRKNESDFFVFETEYRYWQSFTATLFVFFGFLISAVVWKSYGSIVKRVASYNELVSQKYFCESLKDVKLDERLQVAIGLNLVNQLSNECLDREADFVLWKEKKSDYSLAYYAKSLTTENPAQENEYLQQACAGQDGSDFSNLTFGCQIAYSFLHNQLDRLYSEIKEVNFLSETLKYELSLAQNKSGDIDKNFSELKKYNNLKMIKKYRLTEMLAYTPKKNSERTPASLNEQNKQQMNDEIIELIGEL